MLACWTAGITVVSVASRDDWQAITVNSFASVSMAPPLVCLNIANRLDTRDYMAREGHFAISILSARQLDLGKRFAGYFDDQFVNRFDGLTCETTPLRRSHHPRCHGLAGLFRRTADRFRREYHVHRQSRGKAAGPTTSFLCSITIGNGVCSRRPKTSDSAPKSSPPRRPPRRQCPPGCAIVPARSAFCTVNMREELLVFLADATADDEQIGRHKRFHVLQYARIGACPKLSNSSPFPAAPAQTSAILRPCRE